MIAGHIREKLFGTDGIRGTMGNYPLDRDSVYRLGHALGEFTHGARVVIGRDTRESGREIESLLRAGIGNRSQVFSCGIVPTPGLSYITDRGPFDYGIMITASHNPYTDNGIKLFDKNGEKLPVENERDIESLFYRTGECEAPSLSELPPCQEVSGNRRLNAAPARAVEMYEQFLLDRGCSLPALRVVLDCANGATFRIAPKVFKAAGIDTVVTHAFPDGRNINKDCGSMHLDQLKTAVSAHRADLGIAFDGDGDRVLMVDNDGRYLDGDHVLYIMTRYYLEYVTPFEPVVVGTVMSNLGLENALKELNVRLIRSDVGDKNVYFDMKKFDSVIGGEPSGHTILRRFQRTGDGILTAFCFLEALGKLDITSSTVFDLLPLYPQTIKNVKIKEKRDLGNWPELQAMTADFNRKYGDKSRLLIRYSGTEPKVRIMLEASDSKIIEDNIDTFAGLF